MSSTALRSLGKCMVKLRDQHSVKSSLTYRWLLTRLIPEPAGIGGLLQSLLLLTSGKTKQNQYPLQGIDVIGRVDLTIRKRS